MTGFVQKAGIEDEVVNYIRGRVSKIYEKNGKYSKWS